MEAMRAMGYENSHGRRCNGWDRQVNLCTSSPSRRLDECQKTAGVVAYAACLRSEETD
jgi:hypothetical protein